jgi:hypothetical protein
MTKLYSKLVEDAGLEEIHTSFHLKTECGKKNLLKLLSSSTSKKTIERASFRQKCIRGFRTLTDSEKSIWNKHWTDIREIEDNLEKQKANFDINNPTKEVFKDTIGQLSFQDEYFKPLNSVPYILLFVSLFKRFMVPGMAILMPLFTWIAPYIFLRYVYQLEISFKEYTGILWSVWSGSTSDEPLSYKTMAQGAFFLFSFVQGIIQPVLSARVCETTDQMIYAMGTDVLTLQKAYLFFKESSKKNNIPFHFSNVLDPLSMMDPRMACIETIEQPQRLDRLFESLGELEVLYTLSLDMEFNEVSFVDVKAVTPYLHIEEYQDLRIPPSKRVPSSFHMDSSSHHSLLTGPNGGGKSSSLRAILQVVLFSQVFGYACAKKIRLRPFQWISSGLLLRDIPGMKSMFESEVRFAVQLLRKNRGIGLVLFDELFHSTNPPDGIRTAKKFLGELWKKSSIASIVSTHVFEIVEKAPSHVMRLCVPASFQGDKITYSYRLQEGICKVSSVEQIWKQEGLQNCG